MAFRKIIAVLSLATLLAEFPCFVLARQGSTPQQAPAIRATTELVLVNVVARDKKGNLVRDL